MWRCLNGFDARNRLVPLPAAELHVEAVCHLVECQFADRNVDSRALAAVALQGF